MSLLLLFAGGFAGPAAPAPDLVAAFYPDMVRRTPLFNPRVYDAPSFSFYPFPLPDFTAALPTQPYVKLLMEGATGVYRSIITDANGSLLVPDTARLSVYTVGNAGHCTFIRHNEDALNAHGVTFYSTLQTDLLRDGTALTYNMKWLIEPRDTTILNDQLQIERHVVLFEWTYDAQAGKKEFVLGIKNLHTVP